MVYLYAKAIHIIFVVCWMAGLFYIVRLFIYHIEAKRKSAGEYTILHKQFVIMESKLWWIITTPAMYLTIAAGALMLYLSPSWLQMGWMHVKLLFVAGLVVYHFICQRIMRQLAAETCTWSSTNLRLWNELATLFLFAIVFTIVLKSAINWIFGVVGLVGLSVVLMMAVKLYKKYRKS
ncbi:CopD family protein [Sphingobacterium spiritivorum]|uniref:Protoporphyrinogen IX oxidase n=1 Tax=Sphingobacterium spiritivorum ATCC 33861 TaxID=525373 RepID=D7VN08_SPHSI|nr:CopD family protein [Sphingobacterium spiritivorum]EFK57305.1 TIGR00701 family protein [Sphingobacterium spiritivorum ATCC 33861]QQT36612.1 CopD family protein [Sphingobacterium spiritivorum]WQD33364.1 CopD family protein [Sphingobacterium spiritivorum]SUJ22785.1 Predicted membrane protein [Sphingobacterium spiritivorum]